MTETNAERTARLAQTEKMLAREARIMWATMGTIVITHLGLFAYFTR